MAIRWLTLFLDFPAADFAPGAAYWQRLAGCGRSPARGGTGQFATLLPPSGDAYLRVQRIDDGPGGCHLDLHLDLTASSLDQTARRAGALGARVVHREPGLITLHSPGGFPFCLVGWHGERVVPAAIELDGTGLHRADQLCLDIPAAKVEAEAAFWSALTGWPQRSSTLPQFGSLQRPEGIAIRLLFQRRDESGQDHRVTGHIDLACADPDRLAERHLAAGARIEARFEHWIAMADPVGRQYCLTGRPPAGQA